MHLASMPAATTAVSQPIRPFKRANRTNPIDNIDNAYPVDNAYRAYPEGRAAYNRHIGALLSLDAELLPRGTDAELLHAFHEAVASGGVVQAPRHPEDFRRDRAVPATQGVAQPRSGAVVGVPHGIPALLRRTIMALFALLVTCSSGASLLYSLAL